MTNTTFIHPKFVEFTIYADKTHEQTDGDELTAEQTKIYEAWVSKVASEFDFSDATDADHAGLVLRVGNGVSHGAYWKGGEREDPLYPELPQPTDN